MKYVRILRFIFKFLFNHFLSTLSSCIYLVLCLANSKFKFVWTDLSVCFCFTCRILFSSMLEIFFYLRNAHTLQVLLFFFLLFCKWLFSLLDKHTFYRTTHSWIITNYVHPKQPINAISIEYFFTLQNKNKQTMMNEQIGRAQAIQITVYGVKLVGRIVNEIKHHYFK